MSDPYFMSTGGLSRGKESLADELPASMFRRRTVPELVQLADRVFPFAKGQDGLSSETSWILPEQSDTRV